MNDEPVSNKIEDDIYLRSAFFRYLALIAALLAWTFDGVEQGVYSYMTRPALLDLVPGINELNQEKQDLLVQIESRKAEGASVEDLQRRTDELTDEIDGPVGKFFGLALAFWLFGAAAGGVLFGWMGDHIGRVKSLVYAVIVYSLFTGLSAFSPHWLPFVACRFLGALGLGGAWPLSVALIMETWPDRNRPVLAGLMGMGANIGYWIAASYSEYMRDLGYNWRWVIGMGCIIGLSSLLVIVFVPESTKWKQSRMKKQSTSIKELFTPQYRRASIVGMLLSTVALVGTWGSFLWLAAYADQIAQGTDFAATAGSTVGKFQTYGQIIGGFMGGVLAGVMGNKRSWCFLCITAWVSVLALFGFNDVFGSQMLWMGALAGLFVTAFFGWLPKYLPELFPTRIRATGQGFSYNFGRIITGFCVIGAGFLVDAFKGDYRKGMMVMCCVYLLGLIVIMFAPDTGGKMVTDEEDEAAMNREAT